MATKKAYFSELDRGEPMMFDSEGDVANPLKVKDKPFAGEGSTYIGGSGLPSKAGAGRSGGKGGATAKELKKYEDRGDTYTLGGGRQVSVKPNEELYYDKEKSSYAARPKKMAKGGMTSASRRADGIAQRGKTRA